VRKRLVASLAFGLAIVPALATAPAACFPQGQCDFTSAEYCAPGDTSCAGHLIDPYTWESGPIDGAWLDFRHNKTWLLHFRDGVTQQTIQGTVYEPLVWIAPEAEASAPGGQYVTAGGNLAEWSTASDATSLNLHNDTCADYFFRVVVHASPDGTPPDAGADASQDASQDAATE